MGGGNPWPNPDGGGWNNQEIGEAYSDMREACARLEAVLDDDDHGLRPKDFKRADKAVTVMKAGFKILKKANRRKRDIHTGKRTTLEIVMHMGTVADFRRTPEEASRSMVQQIQDQARRL